MTKLEMLKLIKEKVCDCQKCPALVANRTQIVFDNINYEEDNQLTKSGNADILFIGEAPGADEDKTGIPFVGQSGKLLDNIIKAAGWKREDVYICNILKCRPPGNRNPKNEEATNCRPFLNLQIKVINPKYIICLGKIAAYYLLNPSLSIDEYRINMSRGVIHNYENRKVLCTYHPSYLLRNPAAKVELWNDILLLKEEMKV